MNQDLKLDQLEFDHNNFRYSVLNSMTQEEIYNYFVEYSEGFQILKSEMIHGIASAMKFLVYPSEKIGKYIVLDGNTRLSVLTYLTKTNQLPKDYFINCKIFDSKLEAKDEIAWIHTKKDIKTPWTKIAQARYNTEYLLHDREDELLKMIDNHFHYIGSDEQRNHINDQFTYKNNTYSFFDCLESKNGDNFANFFIKVYKLFSKCSIILPNEGSSLNVLQKKLLRQLMEFYINEGTSQLKEKTIKNLHSSIINIQDSLPYDKTLADLDDKQIAKLITELQTENQDKLLFPVDSIHISNSTGNQFSEQSLNSENSNTASVLTNTDITDPSNAVINNFFNEDERIENISKQRLTPRKLSESITNKNYQEKLRTLQEQYTNQTRGNISYLLLTDIQNITNNNMRVILCRVLLESLLIEYYYLYFQEELEIKKEIKKEENKEIDSIEVKTRSIINTHIDKLQNDFPDDPNIKSKIKDIKTVLSLMHSATHGQKHYSEDSPFYTILTNIYPVLYLLVKQVN